MKQYHWIVIIIIIVGVITLNGFDTDSLIAHKESAPKQKPEPRHAAITSELKINEYETVKVLSIPDSMLENSPIFDSKCLIYVNKEIGQSQIKCLTRTGTASE